MCLRQSRGDGSKAQLRQLVPGIAQLLLVRSCIPSFARRSALYGEPRRALLHFLALSGTRGVAQPSRPGLPARQCRTAWAPRIEEVQERPLPASGGAGAAPPPKTPAPASWRLTCITWWLGGRGHRRKGQLRALRQPIRAPRQ
jgi:hypothetical protein